MSAVPSLELGHNLDEFTITKVLGAGGFGITYQAIDRTLQRNVAIKEYFPTQFAERRADYVIVPRSGDENAETFHWGLNRFLTEARTLARLDHPNVVKVSRYFERNGTAYLVMAFEEGKDLEDWLRERTKPPTSDEIRHFILPLLDGLESIHAQGLIHRDIKPRNIVIRGNGTPVLIDFGSARAVGQQQTTLTTLISPGYSPPEQYSSDPSAQGPWTDIYAMAGVVYRMIGGSGPPEALNRISGSKMQRAADVAQAHFDAGILAAVDRGLELDAGLRPRSVAEYRALLLGRAAPAPKKPAQSDADSDATYVRKTQPAPSAARSSRPVWIGGGAVAVAALGVAGYFLQQSAAPGAQDESATVPAAVVEEVGAVELTAPVAPAVEPEPVPASHSLTLNLTPADATAEVEGQQYRSGMQLPQGDYTVTVSKPGYVTATRKLSIDRDVTMEIGLERATYPFTIATSPEDAQVRVGNIRQTYKPALALPPGDYHVEVSAAGYVPWQGTVSHGTSATRHPVSLVPLYTLTLNLAPADADVRVAGERYEPNMRLAAGEYVVTAEKPGYEPASQTVVVDRDSVVDISLAPSVGVLTLILRPSDAQVVLPDLGRSYTPGMRLPVGPVRVRVSRTRYETADREVMIRPGNNAIVFNLDRAP